MFLYNNFTDTTYLNRYLKHWIFLLLKMKNIIIYIFTKFKINYIKVLIYSSKKFYEKWK